MSQIFILIGLQGVGKSAIGKGVSHDLSLRWIDLDSALLQKFQSQKTIRELFIEIGLLRFQEEEKIVFDEILMQRSSFSPILLSLGGGAIHLFHGKRALENCHIIYLYEEKEHFYDRMVLFHFGKKHKDLPGWLQIELQENYNDTLFQQVLYDFWKKRDFLYRTVAKDIIDMRVDGFESVKKIIINGMLIS